MDDTRSPARTAAQSAATPVATEGPPPSTASSTSTPPPRLPRHRGGLIGFLFTVLMGFLVGLRVSLTAGVFAFSPALAIVAPIVTTLLAAYLFMQIAHWAGVWPAHHPGRVKEKDNKDNAITRTMHSLKDSLMRFLSGAPAPQEARVKEPGVPEGYYLEVHPSRKGFFPDIGFQLKNIGLECEIGWRDIQEAIKDRGKTRHRARSAFTQGVMDANTDNGAGEPLETPSSARKALEAGLIGLQKRTWNPLMRVKIQRVLEALRHHPWSLYMDKDVLRRIGAIRRYFKGAKGEELGQCWDNYVHWMRLSSVVQESHGRSEERRAAVLNKANRSVEIERRFLNDLTHDKGASEGGVPGGPGEAGRHYRGATSAPRG